MTDLSLKVRQCKRMGGTKLDLSNMGLTSLPDEVFALSGLETLNISNNSISSLDKIDIFSSLRDLTASNNKIAMLSKDLQNLKSLESIRLDGNPVAVSSPGLSACFGGNVKRELSSYFGGSGGSSPAFLSGDSSPAFLSGGIGRGAKPSGGGDTPPRGGGPGWLAAGAPSRAGTSAMERPTTASSQAVKLRQVEESLAQERASSKRLQQEISQLKAELTKSATMGGSSTSTSEGRIPAVPGVREIEFEELEQGS